MGLFLVGLVVASIGLAIGVSIAEWHHTWAMILVCGAIVGVGVGLGYAGGAQDERARRRTSHQRDRVRR